MGAVSDLCEALSRLSGVAAENVRWRESVAFRLLGSICGPWGFAFNLITTFLRIVIIGEYLGAPCLALPQCVTCS